MLFLLASDAFKQKRKYEFKVYVTFAQTNLK